jgi:hypothetical protein
VSVSGSTRRTPKSSKSMSRLSPFHHDMESPSDKNNNNDDQKEEISLLPRIRTLVRRNSFVNLRRAGSARSIVRRDASCDDNNNNVDNNRLKAKATALTALVLARTEQGLALQRQRRPPVETNEKSSSDSSESIVLTSSHEPRRNQSMQVPVVPADAHPVLALLSGELWSDDKAIVTVGLEQLIKLCQDDGDDDHQNKSIFSQAGYSSLCGVWRKWFQEKEILIAGFRLLQMTSENFALGAFGCGALECIVAAMNNFGGDGPLQAAACGALATIVSTSKSGPSIKLAVDLNGPVVLIKAMESFPDSIEVQKKATMTFLSMARFPQLCDYLEGSMAVVRASMDKFGLTSLVVAEQMKAAVAAD